MPRPGVELTTSRLHSFIMAKVSHAHNHSAMEAYTDTHAHIYMLLCTNPYLHTPIHKIPPRPHYPIPLHPPSPWPLPPASPSSPPPCPPPHPVPRPPPPPRPPTIWTSSPRRFVIVWTAQWLSSVRYNISGHRHQGDLSLFGLPNDFPQCGIICQDIVTKEICHCLDCPMTFLSAV